MKNLAQELASSLSESAGGASELESAMGALGGAAAAAGLMEMVDTAGNINDSWNRLGLTFGSVSDEMKAENRRIYISFQGVESAYYVYLNGKEVGYSEDSYSPHRFDITDYLIEGENLLAVKVHKFCDGTWFEDQDMIYDGGIFRDVYLTSEPLVKIEDYVVVTDLDENYENAVLSVKADVRNLSTEAQSGWSIAVQAFDEDGKDILGGASIAVDEVASTETESFSVDISVEKPELWSAEKPNLYALVLTLKDGEGKVVEHLSVRPGYLDGAGTRYRSAGALQNQHPGGQARW